MSLLVAALPFLAPGVKRVDLPGNLPDWIDPLVLDPWQLLAFSGFFVGIWVAQSRAREWKLSMAHMTDLALFVTLMSLLMAHWFHLFLYDFGEHLAEWDGVLDAIKDIFLPFYGLSSFGGFFGAALALFLYVRVRGISPAAYGDGLVYGLCYGFLLGRIGCSLAHDHPGRLVDSFLSIPFPAHYLSASDPGGLRLDLGMLEVPVWMGLALLVTLTLGRNRERYPWGWSLAVVPMVYAPIRFTLDFFRAVDLPHADPRRFGLTPGQWSAIALFLAGFAYYRRLRSRPPAGEDTGPLSGTPRSGAGD